MEDRSTPFDLLKPTQTLTIAITLQNVREFIDRADPSFLKMIESNDLNQTLHNCL
ncbi:hypothetical protein [Acetobacter orientalis]|uniref:hypothetical protein n=1 Tax=Acetobacter orientalis TaxID=146474 RepID=UPI0015D6AC6D|nr:hypothetical protein [Acetobacter orientalis]